MRQWSVSRGCVGVVCGTQVGSRGLLVWCGLVSWSFGVSRSCSVGARSIITLSCAVSLG
jgi:hypothetical protein